MSRVSKRDKNYKIAVGILSAVIILQWIFISNLLRRPQPKEEVKPAPEIKKPSVRKEPKGKIAIVLDDWGYNLNQLEEIERLRYPITVSVLPHLSYSQQISRELHDRGYEVILHLPMEPTEKYRLEKNTILVSMDGSRVSTLVRESIASISHPVGASNHMGSKATTDAQLLKAVFKELKRRKMYFLDSYVTAGSVCKSTATDMKIKFAKRDIFLDNKQDADYIKKQLYKLKAKARLQGYAIGVGHDRPLTLKVLKETMPELEKEGYKFVFVSELVK